MASAIWARWSSLIKLCLAVQRGDDESQSHHQGVEQRWRRASAGVAVLRQRSSGRNFGPAPVAARSRGHPPMFTSCAGIPRGASVAVATASAMLPISSRSEAARRRPASAIPAPYRVAYALRTVQHSVPVCARRDHAEAAPSTSGLFLAALGEASGRVSPGPWPARADRGGRRPCCDLLKPVWIRARCDERAAPRKRSAALTRPLTRAVRDRIRPRAVAEDGAACSATLAAAFFAGSRAGRASERARRRAAPGCWRGLSRAALSQLRRERDAAASKSAAPLSISGRLARRHPRASRAFHSPAELLDARSVRRSAPEVPRSTVVSNLTGFGGGESA